MDGRHDMPGAIRELIDSLSQVEDDISEDPRLMQRGSNLIKQLPEHLMNGRINVFPGGVLGGCHDTLLVAIGHVDVAEMSILHAVEHISERCRGTTRNVVFWAAGWNSASWLPHKSSFRNVTAILKPFFAEPTFLNTS